MASTAEAVTTEIAETPQDLDSKLDKLFGTGEAPTQDEPEAEVEAVEAEPSDEAEPAETAPQEESIEVEFNGTKYQVPPELKDVLMKSSDYTQKTQSLAQQRRDVELQMKEISLARESAAFEQSVAEEVNTLRMLEQYIPYVKQSTQWDALNTDQFVRKQKEISDLIDQHTQLARALEGKRAEHMAKVEGERKKLKTEMQDSLRKAIPSWDDKVQAEVEAYVKNAGYPEIAVPNMSSLDYQMAWKAAQYDKLKASSATAVKKAAEAPVIKATARVNAMPKQVRAKLDLNKAVKSGNQRAIDTALDKRLDQLFGG